MDLRRFRIWIVLVIIMIVSGVYVTNKLQAKPNDIMTVKLFSGGNLVSTWNEARNGRIEGNTYIFDSGYPGKQVRISGTYSAEVTR